MNQKLLTRLHNLRTLLLLAATLGGTPQSGLAQEAKPAAEPMQTFERLVGGEWHLEGGKPLNAFNRYEWGVGRKAIAFKSYVIGKDATTLRAEGFFTWDPAKKVHVTHVASADGSLYDGEWTIEASQWTMNFALSTAGGVRKFRETWVFPDQDTYVWTLFSKAEDGAEKQQYQATFRRQPVK